MAIQGQLPKVFLRMMAGCVEGIRRALVLDLVLIAGTAIEQAPSVGPFANATLLAHPRCDVSISLTSDTSDRGVGAIFEQFVDSRWQPFALFSKQLRKPDLMYSTFDRELLARYR